MAERAKYKERVYHRIIPVCAMCLRITCLHGDQPCKTRQIGTARETKRTEWQLDRNDFEPKEFYCQSEVERICGKQEWTTTRVLA